MLVEIYFYRTLSNILFFFFFLITDGYSNVVAIETDLDDGPNRTYVRFETFEKMKDWMLDIKNEAQNMVAATDEEIDWWENLFGAVC